MPRLAIVLSHPTQYYSPWFRWMAAHAAVAIRVFYLWDFGVTQQRDPQFQHTLQWDTDLLSGYEWEMVPNVARRPGTDHFWGLRNPELWQRLRIWQPDAVLLFGYNYATHLRLIAGAKRDGLPLIFRGDSHLLGREKLSGPRRWLLRCLYRQFSAVTYVGTANREYFRRLGVAENRLFFAPHSVDASHFRNTPEREAEATQLRQSLGLAHRRVVLFAGKFVSAKQPGELLRAFTEVAEPQRDALVYVGDGPEKAKLEVLARLAPQHCIRFLPFANQSEMPARYRMADIFCLPSRGLYETWGLAVNEAMHMGRPCLVSDRVGCQQDLVTDGVTGWVFPSEDAAAFRAKLAQALSTDIDPMRPTIAQRITGYTYEQTTAGLLAALASLAPKRSPASARPDV
ncbi:MAG: Alpha-D-kanosaminyltransferase [Verrucomicrobia bacterium ADurb.Bin122]|nr:MAG: Alpha-D-kanosaminyltransferase [Verrucomicrobia bacterium ADurb.Bin122]